MEFSIIKNINKAIILIAGVGVLYFFSSCKKEKPETNIVPEITFVQITPTTVKEYSDSLVITISYKDGDGDLGENNPDTKNLFLTDNRIGITYAYRIKQLAPSGSEISITGELNVVLPQLAITDSSNSQQATFSIYVKDRALNQSNIITTPAVTIYR